ncbi:hypothetical protein EJ066_24415 [Mesorhizobium sp. M9A.F.Ca.ET.002.03.1.2]|nr:hypothetical protein EJ066_24415 [Mesorhizobium sp. M9A.F.Ca.ET.002.03.1.2]
MSRKSVQRFCDNDMHKNKDLKRVAVQTRRALEIGSRQSGTASAGCVTYSPVFNIAAFRSGKP